MRVLCFCYFARSMAYIVELAVAGTVQLSVTHRASSVYSRSFYEPDHVREWLDEPIAIPTSFCQQLTNLQIRIERVNKDHVINTQWILERLRKLLQNFEEDEIAEMLMGIMRSPKCAAHLAHKTTQQRSLAEPLNL